MTDRVKKYLSDIISAIDKIEIFVSDINGFENYKNDSKTKSAVERQLAIIGEATNKIAKEKEGVKIENTFQIVGLRNRLIHSYDSTEDTVIWAIVVKHLPNLKKRSRNTFEIIQPLIKVPTPSLAPKNVF